MKDIERGIFHFYKMNIKTLLLVTIFVTLYSCEDAKKKEEMNPGTLGSVNVKIENIVYDGTDDITKLLSNDRIPYTEGRLVQQSRVVFNDDLDLVAEMTQEVAQPFKKSASVSVKPNKRAEAEPLELKSDIRYKVIVYNVDGSYVTEKNYARGLESSTEALKLDGGKTYSFIVYSVNSSTELPDVVFSNPSNKTLATSSVNFNGAADFMYYRKEMTVSGDYQNYLDVVLKHKMSQIITTIDASETEYNVTAVTSSITPHNSTANIKLSDGTLSRTGSVGNSTVNFPVLGTVSVVSAPTIINADDGNNTAYTIASITVGPITKTNIPVFTNLVITPGMKYNIKLKLVTEDEYTTLNGVPVVKINGQVWMRHNLGADLALDPDQTPSVQGLHGNYYQWGKLTMLANAATDAGAISGWTNNSTTTHDMWNSGSETIPAKTSTDPCPDGFRIPTHTEQLALVNATTQEDIGVNGASDTNYSAAKIFRSKKKRSIQLTFPLAGNRSLDAGKLSPNRGVSGYYWTSTIVAANNSQRHHYGLHYGSTPNEGKSLPAWGFCLKCIKQ